MELMRQRIVKSGQTTRDAENHQSSRKQKNLGHTETDVYAEPPPAGRFE
jgi:hypothetical protein